MAGVSRAQRRLLWEMADGYEIWDTTEGAFLVSEEGKWTGKRIRSQTLEALKEQECVDKAWSGKFVTKYRINDFGMGCARQ